MEEKMAKSDNPEIIEQEAAMRTALLKARGEKILDDTKLLQRTVKNRDRSKKKSAKEWAKRLRQVERSKAEKQKKRAENIASRKSKKTKK